LLGPKPTPKLSPKESPLPKPRLRIENVRAGYDCIDVVLQWNGLDKDKFDYEVWAAV
jgi:hypothetical protein